MSIENRTALPVVFTADDFGFSKAVNAAIIKAHRAGRLSCASLMVGGEAWEEAVDMAKANPMLGIGLHITLSNGLSVLEKEDLPDLVDHRRRFLSGAVASGFRYYCDPRLRKQLKKEIKAQWARFRATGLIMDHLNGHLNIHLHPTVLGLLLDEMLDSERIPVRLTREPLMWKFPYYRNGLCYRLVHWMVFSIISSWAMRRLRFHKVPFSDRVFGLLESGQMSLGFVDGVLKTLSSEVTEFYFHPGSNPAELDLLLSRDLGVVLERRQVRLVRCQDLFRADSGGSSLSVPSECNR